VWDTNGHIVTNYHVIRGASEVQVSLIDQSTWPAKIVAGGWMGSLPVCLLVCVGLCVLDSQPASCLPGRPPARLPACLPVPETCCPHPQQYHTNTHCPLPPPCCCFPAGDPSKDIAVLQLEAPAEVLAELKPVNLGASSGLMVGQKVFAIGGWVERKGWWAGVHFIGGQIREGSLECECRCTRTHQFLRPPPHPPSLKARTRTCVQATPLGWTTP
jgi:hypothetical protein